MKTRCMKQVTLTIGLALLLAGFGTSTAMASFNVGASLTDSEVEESGFDADDSNYKIFGGWRFMDSFGVEAQYVDFGDFDFGPGVSIKSTSLDFFAVGIFKVWRFELFGKAGLAYWDTDVSGFSFSDDSGTDFAYGAGAAFRLGDRVHIRGEWEVFDVDEADIDMFSLGLDFRF